MALPSKLPDYRAMATQTAQRYKIPPGIFSAQIGAESNFDPKAVSPAGAKGLGQLMPGTAAGLGVDPNDPAQNLDGAARYLQTQFKRFKSWPLALAAYNAGPGAVEKYGGIPPYAETQSYVKKVLGNAKQPGFAPARGGSPTPTASTSVPQSPMGDVSSRTESQPTLGMSIQDVLNFSSPSAKAVGILRQLGGTAAKVADAARSQGPIPTAPIGKTVGRLETGSTKKGKEILDLQVDHAEPISPAAAGVVEQASKYLGTPYLWGGADPRKGFDCSGFVQFLYKQQGIAIPRTTYQQVKVGQPVHNPEDLAPGDIVLFSDKGDIHHEGLYIGDGQFIHAPRTGDVVKISSLNEPYYKQQFFVGRRITKGGNGAG